MAFVSERSRSYTPFPIISVPGQSPLPAVSDPADLGRSSPSKPLDTRLSSYVSGSHSCFRHLDADRDGHLRPDDVARVAAVFGQRPTDQDLRDVIFELGDSDSVDSHHFVGALGALTESDLETELSETWRW